MRRVCLWSCAGLSLTSLLALAVCCQGPPRTRVGPDWTPEKLVEELRAAGEEWESHPAPGGLLLRRGSAPEWEELLDDLAARPHRWGERPGVLYVGTAPAQSSPLIDARPGTLQIRHLLLRGHPADVRRVADLLDW